MTFKSLNYARGEKRWGKRAAWLFVGIVFYTLIASSTRFLPPLFGVGFVLFLRFYKDKNTAMMLGLILALLVAEMLHGLPVGVLLGIYILLNFTLRSFFELSSNKKANAALCLVIFYGAFCAALLVFDALEIGDYAQDFGSFLPKMLAFLAMEFFIIWAIE